MKTIATETIFINDDLVFDAFREVQKWFDENHSSISIYRHQIAETFNRITPVLPRKVPLEDE